MKVKVFVLCLALFAASSAKITKKSRSAGVERQLDDIGGGSGNAEQMLDASDTNAINNADARMTSLVNSVNRLKVKLQRELQTTVSYLRYHFNQRDVFDKRIMMHALNQKGAGQQVRERRLVDQPMLKDYGKIEEVAKEENFEVVKVPENAETKEQTNNGQAGNP